MAKTSTKTEDIPLGSWVQSDAPLIRKSKSIDDFNKTERVWQIPNNRIFNYRLMHAPFITGLYIGWRTYNNGFVTFHGWDESPTYTPTEWLRVGLIVTNSRMKPIAVKYESMKIIKAPLPQEFFCPSCDDEIVFSNTGEPDHEKLRKEELNRLVREAELDRLLNRS